MYKQRKIMKNKADFDISDCSLQLDWLQAEN